MSRVTFGPHDHGERAVYFAGEYVGFARVTTGFRWRFEPTARLINRLDGLPQVADYTELAPLIEEKLA